MSLNPVFARQDLLPIVQNVFARLLDPSSNDLVSSRAVIKQTNDRLIEISASFEFFDCIPSINQIIKQFMK